MFKTSTLKVIWALGESDPRRSDLNPPDYHGSIALNRGLFYLMFKTKTLVHIEVTFMMFCRGTELIPAGKQWGIPISR